MADKRKLQGEIFLPEVKRLRWNMLPILKITFLSLLKENPRFSLALLPFHLIQKQMAAAEVWLYMFVW